MLSMYPPCTLFLFNEKPTFLQKMKVQRTRKDIQKNRLKKTPDQTGDTIHSHVLYFFP